MRIRTNSDLENKKHTLTWYDEDYWQWNVQNKVITSIFLLSRNCPCKLNWKLNNKHFLRAYVFKHQEKNSRYQQCSTVQVCRRIERTLLFVRNILHECKICNGNKPWCNIFNDSFWPRMSKNGFMFFAQKIIYLMQLNNMLECFVNSDRICIWAQKTICHITITSHILEPYYMLHVQFGVF